MLWPFLAIVLFLVTTVVPLPPTRTLSAHCSFRTGERETRTKYSRCVSSTLPSTWREANASSNSVVVREVPPNSWATSVNIALKASRSHFLSTQPGIAVVVNLNAGASTPTCSLQELPVLLPSTRTPHAPVHSLTVNEGTGAWGVLAGHAPSPPRTYAITSSTQETCFRY